MNGSYPPADGPSPRDGRGNKNDFLLDTFDKFAKNRFYTKKLSNV